MPDAVHLGPLYMNGVVLSHVLAGIGGWLALRWWMGKHQVGIQLEILLNSLLIIVLFWKLGWVLFRIETLWESPANLLLISGSVREVWLGTLVALVYIAISSFRRGIPWRSMIDLSVLLSLLYITVQSALSAEYGKETMMPWGWSPVYEGLSYHPIHWYRAFAVASLLLWMRNRGWELGHGRYAAKGLLGYGMIKLAISFFDRETALALFLTFDQLIAVLLILLGYVMNDRSIIKQERSDME